MRHTAVAQTRYSPFIPNEGFTAQTSSIPASVGGWDTISGLAQMPPANAVQMDNWIPRTGWLEIRRGFVEHATGVGSADSLVESLMAYNGVAVADDALFAVADGKIWDVTVAGPAVDTGKTSTDDRWQYTNFTNESTAANYLVIANGSDTPLIWNGTAWANVSWTMPAGYSSSDVIQPHAHQGRLWMVLKESNEVTYLPIGAIAGTAVKFPLGPLMSEGGYIMAAASWTVDTRLTVSDYIVFITSRGQAIVYMGTDPATNFTLVGVYDVGAPIGRRCFLKTGGDLVIISIEGLLPMSQVLGVDRAALTNVSISKTIAGAMAQATQNYGTNFGWQLVGYPKGNLAILNVPQVQNQTAVQFVMNTNTGAWCSFSGIDANVWEILATENTIFFGGNDGTVYQWDVGSGDGDMAITATVQTAFNYHGDKGRLKNWTLIRPIITSDGSVIPGMGLAIDFAQPTFVSLPSAVTSTGATWDVSKWDEALWPLEGLTSSVWQTVSGTGQCASVVTRVSTIANGTASGVLLRLNGWTMAYEKGGLI